MVHPDKVSVEAKKKEDENFEFRSYLKRHADADEKIHHLTDQMIAIDLDDVVKHEYEIFKDVLAKIK